MAKNLAKQFTREQILTAIEYIDEHNVALTGSTVYLLEHNNNTYPPKEVLRWAARLAKLENWEQYRLNGGKSINNPLKDLGFSIIFKEDAAKNKSSAYLRLISEYKNIVRNTGNREEIYKYHLIADFQKKWDIDSHDFGEVFLSIEFANLIYHVTALTTLKSFATNDPNFLRTELKVLSDDSVDLQERIGNFCRGLNHRFESMHPGLKGGVDERTVATLLTFIDPNNYTFYKWQFYNELCKLLNKKAAKTGECYIDYLGEVDELIDRFVVEDDELLALHENFLQSCDFKDENYYVLAQDILYQTLKDRNIDRYRSDYQNWLKLSTATVSNKVGSYVKALDILSNLIDERIYDVSDQIYLNHLYQDLLKEQRNTTGKYYYEKSPSYGESGYFSAAIGEYIKFHKELLLNTSSNQEVMNHSLNQILYGPPGTGKTYHTINKAIEIANPDFDLSQDRPIVKEEYQRLVQSGQIVFTTFHQSMSYEDFVEGIKPVLDNEVGTDHIAYTIEDGIFKAICQQAALKKVRRDASINWENKNYFKLSLGGIARPDVHDYCLDNSIIALGYGGEKDLSPLADVKDWHDFKRQFAELNPIEYAETPYSAQAAYTFLRMQVGDVVVASKGNRVIDAVGIVEGNYYYDDNVAIDYKHFRRVRWLSVRMNYKPDHFFDVNISQMTIYEFYKHNIKFNAFNDLFSTKDESESSAKPHVLIIDEINRGNVSAIFGELITLIEDSKRAGMPEHLEVTLPYSKEKFSVPSNLYIIGTMNTADRSVEALDSALRRRFVFEEMLPDPDVLKQQLFGYPASAILETINKRIEKLIDRDHCIGHAYFLHKDEDSMIESFYKNIIPLLQEYFFGDYGKIGLVLGSGFVQLAENQQDVFADFDYEYKQDLSSKPIYQIENYLSQANGKDKFGHAINSLMRDGR